MIHGIFCLSHGLEATSFQTSHHRASKRLPTLSPNAISSVAVASSKINTNCSSGCLRQDVKASPIREKSAATPVRKKSACTGSNLSQKVEYSRKFLLYSINSLYGTDECRSLSHQR